MSFKEFNDHRGTLWVKEDLPFVPKRIFFISEVKSARGDHAHKKLSEFLFVTRGQVVVQLENQRKESSQTLLSVGESILISPNYWRTVHPVSKPCDYTILCNMEYDKKDYIFDKDEFYQYQPTVG